MKFGNYLSQTILVALLIWGPINHSSEFGMVIRTGYLILIPLIVLLFTDWVFNHFNIIDKTEDLFNRILTSIICFTLIILAFLEATSTSHIANTQQILTRDGYEDIGEDILVQGPNWGNVFVLTIVIIVIFWFGVLRKGTKSENS